MIGLIGGGMTARVVVLVLWEHAFIVAAVVVAIRLRLGEDVWLVLAAEHGVGKAVLIAGVCQICCYFNDLYDLRHLADRRGLFIRIAQALGEASFILAALYFWFPTLMIGRGVFLIAAIFVVAIVAGWRLAFDWFMHWAAPRERLLIVGTTHPALVLARELHERRREFGVEIAGFIDPDPDRVGTPLINPGVIGTIEDIPTVVRDRNVDRVVVSLADGQDRLPIDKLLDVRLRGVRFDHLASVYETYTGKIAVEHLQSSWLIFSAGFRKSPVVNAVKRGSDIVLAAVGLILLSPLMLLVAAAAKLTTIGPVLYHQQRVGLNGRLFTVHKFRSMRLDAEASTGAVWARRDGDPRVTLVGGFLRRTRLDELPQLWNILKGEMSLVGPRPERPEFVERLTATIPYYGQRHVVRPGLTGWAQVRYTYGASVEDAIEKLQYDLFYIKNLSLTLDFFIMANTIKTVLQRRGA